MNKITDEDIDKAFTQSKEDKIIDNILNGRTPYREGLYSKEQRTSLVKLRRAIYKIKSGQVSGYELEHIYIPTNIIKAICRYEGICYKAVIRDGKEVITRIGGD